jgi:hypothetical protein
MNKEFIPYQQALELKELGFDEICMGGYDLEDNSLYIGYVSNDGIQYNPEYYTPSPLYQQAFRWFREKYQLYAWVKIEYEYGTITPTYYITGKRQDDIPGGPFNTCEEAELACLKKLIEIIKTK